MDLSLQGSQINLSTRFKPKIPTIKYPILNQQRPVSANISRRPHSSQRHSRRPFSADDKLAQSLDNCIRFSERILNEDHLKKFSGASSSTILKLLLEDPIKRPWLLRDPPQRQSSNSSDEINMTDNNYDYRNYSEDSDIHTIYSKTYPNIPSIKVSASSAASSSSSLSTELKSQKKFNDLKTTQKQTLQIKDKSINPGDFWHETKPDLPGRVSFGKPTDTYNIEDTSDCENHSLSDEHSSNTLLNKKSVHFGKSAETLAQTYEYPKCPSENCSCSSTTRSSSTSTNNCTQQSGIETRRTDCRCELTCKPKTYSKLNYQSNSETSSENHNAQEENTVIADYKKAIKDMVTDENDHPSIGMPNNELDYKIIESPDYEKEYSNVFVNNFENHAKSDISLCENAANKYDHRVSNSNNFSKNMRKNQTIDRYQETKKNSILSDAHNLTTNSTNKRDNAVINNYLRQVSSGSAPITVTKKFNNGNSNGNGNGNSATMRSKPKPKIIKPRRSKSAGTTAAESKTSRIHNKPLTKSDTYSNLRENNNLTEFELDKIDSWMSLHENQCTNQKERFENFQRFSNLITENNNCDRNESPQTETSENSKSDSQDDSTYDEIVSVIKEIEEEKKHENITARNHNHNHAHNHNDLDLKLKKLDSSDASNQTLTNGNEMSESNDKLKDILSYLENVEYSCDRTLMETRRSMPDSNRSEVDFAVEPDITEDVPKLADLLMVPNHQLARRVIALSLRANELSNGVQYSKQYAAQLRQEKLKAIRLEKLNATNRNYEQKKQYESIVSRHQGFIEQLLKDKGTLCEKVNALTRRLESQNQAWEHKLETELTRVKETTMAGEKIRRERWVRENTKKIKELTVKGLEAEINKMNYEHQQTVTNLKRQHQEELLDSTEATRQKYEQIEFQIRESCAQDRESLIEKERNAIRERYDKQLQDEHKTFNDQKNQLIEDFAAERERLLLELRSKDDDISQKRHDMEKERECLIMQIKSEYQDKLEQQDKKNEQRLCAIEKQFETDYQIWKREFETSCKLREVENENSIRQNYRAERDRQIDAIVTRMDSESQKCQEEFENKVNQLKIKHEKELDDLEISEKLIRDKYNESRNRLAEAEAAVQNYQAEIKQFKLELEHSKKMCQEFLNEKEQMQEKARLEVQSEIATLKTERDSEIQNIYKRVQQAIEKKDSTLELLQKENGTLRERCVKLEAVIRQQRKDYCINK